MPGDRRNGRNRGRKARVHGYPAAHDWTDDVDRACEALGITQAELQREAGVSKNFMSNMKRNYFSWNFQGQMDRIVEYLERRLNGKQL